MAKKTLELVRTTNSTWADPPRNLDKPGRSLWDRIMSDYQIEDSGGLEMLGQACAALDRAEECHALVARDGLVFKVKGGGLRENPAAKIELANRAFVVRTLSRLGLEFEAIKTIGRPAHGIGWSGEK
jgi:hypothetical protein